jgi:hypothetical protein
VDDGKDCGWWSYVVVTEIFKLIAFVGDKILGNSGSRRRLNRRGPDGGGVVREADIGDMVVLGDKRRK